MTKLNFKLFLLAMSFLSMHAFAETESKLTDAYSVCVDETIQELGLGNINNAVVDICSHKTKTLYAKQIVQVLDQIKKQSQEYQQPERYSDIMKSQQLWKSFVEQECRNAGAYIGSPMYEYCPMQKYGERLEQLQEYLN
ncbi:hypothetical protein Acal02_01021 [Acinetobacter calcoaceticus]